MQPGSKNWFLFDLLNGAVRDNPPPVDEFRVINENTQEVRMINATTKEERIT